MIGRKSTNSVIIISFHKYGINSKLNKKVTLTTSSAWSPMPELPAIGLPACGPNSWYKHPLTLPRTEQPFEMASGCEHGSVQAKEAYPFLSLPSEPQKVWKKLLPRSRDMTGASSLWFQLETGVSNQEALPVLFPQSGWWLLPSLESYRGKTELRISFSWQAWWPC